MVEISIHSQWWINGNEKSKSMTQMLLSKIFVKTKMLNPNPEQVQPFPNKHKQTVG